MRRTFLTIWLAALSIAAQESLNPSVPEELRVPTAQKLVLQARGVGYQVYGCKAVEDKYAWTLVGPDAKLLGSGGEVVGRHFAGPTWEAKDGSSVSGKVAAIVPSPDPKSVPWLRLDAVGHDKDGIMSEVISIQRLNTMGGKAPADGCSKLNIGAKMRVAYEADYYFYAKAR